MNAPDLVIPFLSLACVALVVRCFTLERIAKINAATIQFQRDTINNLSKCIDLDMEQGRRP